MSARPRVQSQHAPAPAGRDQMLQVQVIKDAAYIADLAPEWERLAASISPRFPFTTPTWCIAWWRHFRRESFRTKDLLRVFVLRDDAGVLVAVAPMFLTERPSVGPIRSRELQFFGADPYVSEFRGPVCRAEDTLAVVEALSAHIRAEAECDWVQWRGLRAEDEGQQQMGAVCSNAKLGLVDHYLEVPESWETFKSSLPRNIKESLRKCYNSLKRERISFEFRVVSQPNETPAAVDEFLRLHRTRADQTDGVKHGNVFEGAQACAMLHDYCLQLAERNELRIFQIAVAGKVIATRIGFVMGDELYLYFSGYDVDWGRFSVMTTTVAEAIKWAIESGFRIVNLSTGTDVSKMRWRPKQVAYIGGYVIFPVARSRLAFRFVETLRQREWQSAPRYA
ncbi:MAG: GNAT family N-acetyltransferase [Hyphomicrobiales bacterium]|nr:GNAT family N-acetyltransferase [Hyphomicrobiales bacterium]